MWEFQTRYGCNNWPAWLPWAFQIADGVIWAAYMTIPFWLIVIYLRRRDLLPQPRMAVAFSGFILTCGFTHAFAILVWFVPAYRVYAFFTIICAIISIYTALKMRGLARHVLQLPRREEVEAIMARFEALRAEIERRNVGSLDGDFQRKIDDLHKQIAELK